MKSRIAFIFALSLVFSSCGKKPEQQPAETWQGITYEAVTVGETPFPMSDVNTPIFPDRSFNIADYGARALPPDGYPTAADSSRIVRTNSQAIQRAMNACAASGGGHVVVSKGKWLSGTVLFDNNCDLYLSEGAELIFSPNPEDFLPETMTTYEGVECYNCQPLIYVGRLNNVGISGPGTLRPVMDVWETWFEPTNEYHSALQILDRWGSHNYTFYLRNISGRKFKLRPPLIQFYQCTNVLLQDFTIQGAPSWAIHLFGCEDGVVRRVKVSAPGRHCDGVALEMSRRFVVEDCVFEQGGDAISVKSGRVLEAWNSPQAAHNIIIRRCEARRARALLSVGEEISHGVHDIYMYDCKAFDGVDDLLSIRTNRRQDSEVTGITVERCEAQGLQRVFGLDSDVYGDWRGASRSKPDTCCAKISGITMRDVKCRRAVALIDITGDTKTPVRDVVIENIHADSVTSFVSQAKNVEGLKTSGIHYGWLGHSGQQPVRPK